MVQTVERTIDRLTSLIHQGRSSHVGDVVALVILLVIVQPGATGEKLSIIQARLQHLNAVCSQAHPVRLSSPSPAVCPRIAYPSRKLPSLYGEPLITDRFMRSRPLDLASLTWADVLMHWEDCVSRKGASADGTPDVWA
ncbi:hypothetical protein C7999DRAFT_16447 [Corynascus novoguineensis]|uniref:Uncharacterized protein n=1 Tax=Corynascus novoguineensis TaxID=1126955 RepID=A0AAN7CP85_9PEZI|nr:hypothetical protein C7999DRAFT_16447 [Corynascus novoguineensis]